MQLTKIHKIIIGVVTVLILGGLFMIFTKKSEAPSQNTETASSTTTTLPGTNIQVQGNGNYTITQVPVENSTAPKIPDLNRPVTFGPTVSLSADVKKIVTDKILALQATLKKDPKSIGSWIDLGTYEKMAGDFSGAILYWKYAADISNDYVSLGNLGNLYAYYLKDNAQAEVYYKKAISRGATQSYLYVQLSDVYKEVFKDLTKAKAILDEGLKKIPNDPALLEAKKNLQ